MRIVRIAKGPHAEKYAVLENAIAASFTSVSAKVFERGRLYDGAPWLGAAETGETVDVDLRELLAPVDPSKILCIGRNYAAHAKELGHEVPKEPLIFLKPPSALLGVGADIELPPQSQRVEHEAELAVIIGKKCRAVEEQDALSFVFGYSCAGDITARDLQKSDGQWSRAKGFDTFCPIGPWIETSLDPKNLRVSCKVNGETRQDGRTSQMMFRVPALIAYVSKMMTLYPGDLLLTGTPEGVGPLAPGDRLEIAIEGIGTLTCGVRRP